MAKLLIGLGLLGLLGASIVGVAAPMQAGSGGAQLAGYALQGRQLAREHATLISARPTPVLALMQKAFEIFGDTPATPRVPAILLTCLAALALAMVAWRGWGPWAAAGAIPLFALAPNVAAGLAVPDQNMAALIAILLGASAYVGYRAQPRWTAAAATTLWLLVAAMCGASAYGFALAVAVGLIFQRPATEDTASMAPRTPLEFVMYQRERRRYARFAVVLAVSMLLLLALLALAKLKGPQSWPSGRVAHGAMPKMSGIPHLIATPFGAVLAVWFVTLAVRVMLRRTAPKDTITVGLAWAAVALLVVPDAHGTQRAVPAPLAALVALFALDLASAVSRQVQRLTGKDGAAAHMSALIAWLAIAGTLAPGGYRSYLAARVPEDHARHELAKFTRQATTPSDTVILHATVVAPPQFLYELDRRTKIATTLAGVDGEKTRDGHHAVVFPDSLLAPAQQDSAGIRLLRNHPATLIGSVWMADLRRYDPGVAVFQFGPTPPPRQAFEKPLLYPSGFSPPLRHDPWREIDLDLKLGVVPAPDRRPEVPLPSPSDRARLLTFHNFSNLTGDLPAKAALRTRLLQGYQSPHAWIDPAPFGWIAGVRWVSEEHLAAIVWECPGVDPAAADFQMRFVMRPIGRNWKPEIMDAPTSHTCAGARHGDLREETLKLKFPYRGHWAVAMEITLPVGRSRRATGHTVDLLELKN